MNQPAAEIVQFDNVGLRYGAGREVLADVSFTLYPGCFYFLTGASGAGKTSLLRMLYLAQRPSRGLIRMFGTDAITLPRERLPGFRRRIGVVFQDFRLVPHLSAWDNVALPLRVAGQAEKDIAKPVSDMLEWVGLGTASTPARPRFPAEAAARGDRPRGDRPARHPGGRRADRQRRPEMAIKLLRLFESLNRLGTTVVVATHDLHLIRKVPDSLIMRLDKGKLADPTGACAIRRAGRWTGPGIIDAAALLKACHETPDRHAGPHPARAGRRRRRIPPCPKRACRARCPGSSPS
jgi:cell division transport system ATP-binding protein